MILIIICFLLNALIWWYLIKTDIDSYNRRVDKMIQEHRIYMDDLFKKVLR